MKTITFSYHTKKVLSSEKLLEIKNVLDEAISKVEDNGIIKDTCLSWDTDK